MKAKTIRVKDSGRTLLYQPIKPTRSGVCATLIGYIRNGKKFLYSTMALAVLATGCANFATTQTDESYEKGQLVRRITTKASATTVIESKSALANFKASQTDKTQTASVGSLSQESNATNTVSDAAVFLGTLIKSAK